jgi:site-specific DNA-methyltransferase (adenine-specific)
MVQASTRPGDWCLDPFCGSGTLGAVCARLGRRYVLVDSSPEAVEVTRRRLAPFVEDEARVPSSRVSRR